ncbi:MAG: hypothetical protein JEY99_10720 [Spirochaetales bacterium]|nr:hypothetical protein [Spirochaetales bacterium]
MKKIYLISHTHWDREWYKPFQYFRTKLIYMIDRLLAMLENNDDFSCFHLDGQTILLEDYLHIRPENEERIRDLIASGRIIVGPWYIQPDEFAPDGESLIRNLQIGFRQARRFGRPMMTGYLPDSFGHSSQMPQILRGFGIDSAVVMRGVDFDSIESTEFTWKALNGEEVLGIYLRKGYINAMFLSQNNSINKIRLKKLAKELGPMTSAGHVLVMNGVDHAFAQEQVADLCRDNSGWKQGSLEDYIKQVKEEVPELKYLEGELITPRHHRVHTSIASTRINQKIENRKLSISLERELEPLCLITSLFGAEYPAGLINEAWKTLIQNQTHDGICGCCTDEVHREMDQRFTSVRQISETLIKNHSRALTSLIDIDGLGLTVFNTALTPGLQYIEAEIIVDEGFILLDDTGNEIETQIVKVEDTDVSKNSIWTLYLGTPQPARKISFIFPCEFDEVLGYRYLRIIPAILKTPVTPGALLPEFENEFYRMSILSDGSLSVYDKESGRSYDGLNTFEDIGEGGDTYNHSPLEGDVPILSRGNTAVIGILEDGPYRKVFNISQTLPTSGEPIRIETQIKTYTGSRRIDIVVEIDNRTLSHRLRALFPFGELIPASFAETQFGVIERSTATPSCGEGWPETPLPIYAMQRFAGLRSEDSRLFVLNRGLTEYEVYQNGESVLAITLHRGVGMMGKADLIIRPGRPSGIEVPTPDAESLGILRREYALITGGNLTFSDIVSEADRYSTPSLAVQNRLNIDRITSDNEYFFRYISIDNLKSVIVESLGDVRPGSRKFIELGSSRLSVSALRKGLDDNSVVLRLFNPGETAVKDETLSIFFPHNRLTLVNLLEDELCEISGDGEYIIPEIKPNTQITIKIAREEIVI